MQYLIWSRSKTDSPKCSANNCLRTLFITEKGKSEQTRSKNERVFAVVIMNRKTKNYTVDNMQNLRTLHNLSQEEAASVAGTTRQSYINYETRKTTPSIGALINLADYYQVSVDYLLGRTNDDSTGPIDLCYYINRYQNIKEQTYKILLKNSKGSKKQNIKTILTIDPSNPSKQTNYEECIETIPPVWPYNLLKSLFGITYNTLWEPLTKDQENGLQYVLNTILPPEQKHVIQYVYKYGMTLDQAANTPQFSQYPKSKVRAMLARGMHTMRNHF